MSELGVSAVAREDVEALARLIADREQVARGALPFGDTSWAHVDKREWIQAAEAILSSSWLAAHDEGVVRATERERLAAEGGAGVSERLWLVEIDEDDWDYDRFQSAVVWAESPEQAEQIIREALRYPDRQDDPIVRGELWIEKPEWRLVVTPAPPKGVALVHWHAG